MKIWVKFGTLRNTLYVNATIHSIKNPLWKELQNLVLEESSFLFLSFQKGSQTLVQYLVSKTLRPLHPCTSENKLARLNWSCGAVCFCGMLQHEGNCPPECPPLPVTDTEIKVKLAHRISIHLVKGKLESKVIKLGQRARRQSCITDLFSFSFFPPLRIKHKHYKDLNKPLNHKGFITCHTIIWYKIVNIPEIWEKKK